MDRWIFQAGAALSADRRCPDAPARNIGVRLPRGKEGIRVRVARTGCSVHPGDPAQFLQQPNHGPCVALAVVE